MNIGEFYTWFVNGVIYLVRECSDLRQVTHVSTGGVERA